MTAGARMRVGLVVVTALLAQLTLLDSVRPAGVHPDALLLMAAIGGLVGGAERGATIGFAAGLGIDLFLHTPFGLTALVFALVGYAVGSLQSAILRSSWWIPVAVAAVASATGVTLWAVAATVLGRTGLLTGRLALVIALVTVMNAALSPLAVRLLRWAMRDPALDRPFAVA